MKKFELSAFVLALGLFLFYGFLAVQFPPPQKVVVDSSALPAAAGGAVTESPTQILVKFKEEVSAEQRSSIAAAHNIHERFEIPGIGVTVETIPRGVNPRFISDQLNQTESDSVDFAEPDVLLEPSATPNDPSFSSFQKDKQQMNASDAWDTATSTAFTVAIADTGVNCQHEDLAGECMAGWNFYDNNSDTSDVYGHGTSVAGVVAALGNNGLGVAGGVWRASILPLRVSAPNGIASYSTIASAIAYAADHGTKVVNVSYPAGGSASVQSAAAYLKSKGGLLVVAEGNSGGVTDISNSPDIISVSGVDAADAKYSWSSYGNDVDVAAPGCTGATTNKDGGYISFCGTSNSAPEVSGILMLIWAVNPLLTPSEAQDILFTSSQDLGVPGWDQYFGWGRIDAARAVIQASVAPATTATSTPSAADSSTTAL